MYLDVRLSLNLARLSLSHQAPGLRKKETPDKDQESQDRKQNPEVICSNQTPQNKKGSGKYAQRIAPSHPPPPKPQPVES